MSFPRFIGVIHLLPLPGAPLGLHDSPASLVQAAGMRAIKEAKMLAQAGFDGLILENFQDAPFYKNRVPAETVAAMSVVAGAVREVFSGAIGINVLRNDAFSALAIASAAGCEFIRVNVISGVAATDQGMIEGEGAELLRKRHALHSEVGILADVHVKHARNLSSESIELAIEEAGDRALADGVIITGTTTGRSVDMPTLKRGGEVARSLKLPLYVGSGSMPETASELLRHAYGVIVGSSFRKSGKAGMEIDTARLKKWAKVTRSAKLKKK